MADKLQASQSTGNSIRQSFVPFRRAIFRGLAIIMPPLLTVVLFLWAGNLILNNILRPIESAARQTIVWVRGDIRTENWVTKQQDKLGDDKTAFVQDIDGHPVFIRTIVRNQRTQQDPWIRIGRSWIRKEVYDAVEENPGLEIPTTAEGYCHRYAQLRYLKPQITIPLFIALFIITLYGLGKLLAVGVGKMIWNWMESLIHRIPLISNVYSSVKQVTDFALSENDIEFTRVVAVEYPRRGIWSIGFVTSESLLDIKNASGEPMVTVLMPTSPMPATGFTISVPRSQALDLNITVDQAIQFVVSCGVVVPPNQLPNVAGPAALRPGTELARDSKHDQNPTSFPATDLTESDGFQIADSE